MHQESNGIVHGNASVLARLVKVHAGKFMVHNQQRPKATAAVAKPRDRALTRRRALVKTPGRHPERVRASLLGGTNFNLSPRRPAILGTSI
mmetsp:Transcript_19453/g.58773  ORF Transcript_19453/g.58773 Transcript_19453/m.58773 type:complete len:91 (+) Transcript_19453:100-372(+)|eukprot:scaffold237347_cov31-Tisochrysis_lutea.AAC.4